MLVAETIAVVSIVVAVWRRSQAASLQLQNLSMLPAKVMSENDAARFRKEAEECRRQAEKAIGLLDKEAWLKMAAEWTKLAQNAEMRVKK